MRTSNIFFIAGQLYVLQTHRFLNTVQKSLISLGHIVRIINRLRSRSDKTKLLNLVFVKLVPATNYKEIHKLKTRCRQRITSTQKRCHHAIRANHLATQKITAIM